MLGAPSYRYYAEKLTEPETNLPALVITIYDYLISLYIWEILFKKKTKIICLLAFLKLRLDSFEEESN
jgi:hypothetical protein